MGRRTSFWAGIFDAARTRGAAALPAEQAEALAGKKVAQRLSGVGHGLLGKIVDGDPLKDIRVIGTGDEWFGADPRPESPETIRVIMKDGKFFKNTLPDEGE